MQSTRWLLYTEQAPSAWFHFALCGLVGIITAYAFVWISQYYTDYKYDPVRQVALASTTGHGTNVIAGYLSSSAFKSFWVLYSRNSFPGMDCCRNELFRAIDFGHQFSNSELSI